MENVFHDTKDSNCRNDLLEQNGIVFHLTSISARVLIKREDFLDQNFDDVLMFLAVSRSHLHESGMRKGRDGSIIIVMDIYVRKWCEFEALLL